MGVRIGVMLAVLAIGGLARADEVRKWKDADGNLHYSVTGSEDAADADEAPVVSGREVGKDETFSVDASLRRRQIETNLRAAGRDLKNTQSEIAAAETRTFRAWVPSVSRDPRSAQSSIDAQSDAYLAASQFEQDKGETLRRLRRQERAKLREIVAYWKDFAALDAAVSERYGTAPPWWRSRLDCGGCPLRAEAESALRGPTAAPTPEAGSSAATDDDEDWGEDEEKWQ